MLCHKRAAYTVKSEINAKKFNCDKKFSQFEFTIRNDGNLDAEISEIIITGVDQYKDYVKVNLSDIENGTKLKEKSSIVVKVLTDYVIQYSDENFVPQVIELDDISIEFKIRKLE